MSITKNLFNLHKNINLYCFRSTTLCHRNLNKQNIIIGKFSHYTPVVRTTRPFREAKYLKRDRIPNGFTIIYRAPMENYLMASKNVSTFTFCLIGAVIAYKLSNGVDLMNVPYEDDVGGLVWGGSDLIYFAVGFLIITVIIRLVIEKYPLRIYRNRDSYIAIFQGQIPFQNKRIFFERGDVSESTSIFLNPWRDSMYKMKQKSVILLENHFKTPSELYEMLTPKNESTKQ